MTPRPDAETDEVIRAAGVVTAVSSSPDHSFTKRNRQTITLVTGLGVEGDAHMGRTIKHRSRVARDPSQPNLRQVHLLHDELHDELRSLGHVVTAGELGENVTTRGIALLELPAGTRLFIGDSAVVQITGLRNPCVQIENFQTGLLAEVIGRDLQGNVVRKAGVMAVVLSGGVIRPGDGIVIEFPPQPHARLEVV